MNKIIWVKVGIGGAFKFPKTFYEKEVGGGHNLLDMKSTLLHIDVLKQNSS